MGAIGEYIISVTSAAVVCGCVCSFFEKKGTIFSVIKLLCGIFLTMTALQPVVNLQIPDVSTFTLAPSKDGESIADDAQALATERQRQYISDQCQSYITQKADALGCSLKISVTTCSEPPYAPNSVRISGNISPNAKGQLTQWIYENLAIKPEDQIWDG